MMDGNKLQQLYGAGQRDFSYVNLAGIDLRGINLVGTSFRGADLTRARLDGTSLINTDFRGAKLNHATLTAADLSWANLTKAELEGADITSATLVGTTLVGANISKTDLQGANLKGAFLTDVDLTQAVASGAILNGSELGGVYQKFIAGPDAQGEIIDGIQLDELVISTSKASSQLAASQPELGFSSTSQSHEVHNGRLSLQILTPASTSLTPATLYEQTFEGAGGYITDTSKLNPNAIFAEQNGRFVASNLGRVATWNSGAINIAGNQDVAISLDIFAEGSLETSGRRSDFLQVAFIVDGTVVRTENWNGTVGSHTLSLGNLSGTTLEVQIAARNDGSDELFAWDNLRVTGIPLTPLQAENDFATTGQDTPVSIDVLGNDSSVQGLLNIVDFSQPTHGTVVTGNNNQLIYVPNFGFHGTDQFSYTITDSNGRASVATVDITVNQENAIPPLDDAKSLGEQEALLDLVDYQDATHIAVKDGSWFDPSTWLNGVVPGDDARAVILKGVNVFYDGESDASLKTLRVDGTLEFASDRNTRMVIDTFVVTSEGTLIIGTEANPIQQGVTANIIIADNGAIDTAWDPTQLSRGFISQGNVSIHGQEKTSHLRLAIDALAGETSLTLAEVPTNWQVGDRIVLTGTQYVPRQWNGQELAYQGTQDEELRISGIEGNRILLDRALQFNHTTPREDLKAYVANYSRNVIFETENHQDLPINQRGHVQFLHSDQVDVRYAEFFELGRTDKSRPLDEVNGTNIRGRYAFNIHRTGVSPDRQAVIAIGNAVWGSPGWGFVHTDSNAVINNNATYDVFGAGYVAYSGNETGEWVGNIAIKAQGANRLVKDTGPDGVDLAHTGAGFWFQGRLVHNRNNVAAGVNNGFVYQHRGQTTNPDIATLPQLEIAKYRNSIGTDRPAIQGFENNEVFASASGLDVVKANPDQGHALRSVLNGFRAWQVETGGLLEYTAHYSLQNFDLIGTGGYYSAGLLYGTNTEDLALVDSRIANFRYGLRLNTSLPGGSFAPLEFDIVGVGFENNEFDLDNYHPDIHRVIGLEQLQPGRLSFSLSPEADLIYDLAQDDRRVVIRGEYTDSIGTARYAGQLAYLDGIVFDFEGIENRLRQGYYRLKDGTPVATVETFVSDRATGEFKEISIPIVLRNQPNSLYLGEYNPGANSDGADVNISITQTLTSTNQRLISTSSADIFQLNPEVIVGQNNFVYAFENNKDTLLVGNNAEFTLQDIVLNSSNSGISNGIGTVISFGPVTGVTSSVLIEGINSREILDDIIVAAPVLV